MKTVMIGHASISETGGINGVAGDSTKKEVCIREWYSKPWTQVYRARIPTLRKYIARGMVNACDNNNIGYGQSDRLGVYNELMKMNKAGKQLSVELIRDISRKVNCDCSSLVAAILICLGQKVNPSMTTYNEYDAIMGTGAFDALGGKVLYTPTLLYVGDILQSRGHTAVVVDGANTDQKQEQSAIRKDHATTTPAYEYTPSIAGTYTVNVKDFLALREKPSKSGKLMLEMMPGQKVWNYGYHTGEWYLVTTTNTVSTFTGFCHSDYLQRA